MHFRYFILYKYPASPTPDLTPDSPYVNRSLTGFLF